MRSITRIYFAYGSNMCAEQMKERCPNSRLVGIGKLRDYCLAFPRFSKSRNCGVASVVQNRGDSTWGVLFELTSEDIGKMDRREGFKPERDAVDNSYNKIEVEVELAGGTVWTCFTYEAVRQVGDFFPSREYVELLIKGARTHKLPVEYINRLETIPTQSPPTKVLAK